MIEPPDLDGVAGVVGVGIDLVDLDRFRLVLERTPALARRCFSDAERAEAARRADPAATLAGRFAAKEAVLKVLGAGIFDVPLVEVEVRGEADRPPVLDPGPQLRRLATDRGVRAWRLSITHSDTSAAAVAIGLGG